MHTEYPIVNNGRNGQNVEASAEFPPNPYVVSPLALVVESIHSIDRLALVVASQKVKVLREFDLVGKKECDGLDTLLSSVHVVTDKEELLIVLWVPRNIE
jgi:hypothetical protein